MAVSERKDVSGVGADHNTAPFAGLANLASTRVGARVLGTNDDFFAPAANLLKPEPAVFIPGKFTSRGKWMDGWESRRRRTPGHDWCVVALGMRGRIRGVVIDTSHFTGNFPSHCSIHVVDSATPLPRSHYGADGSPWTGLLRKSELHGNTENLFAIDDERPWTHVRLNIFPDGGVARLRVFGDVVVEWSRIALSGRVVDLADIRKGGLVLGASDMHFGAKDNMIMPGRAKNMGDGWETRRRRGPGHDWAIVRLGTIGQVKRIEIDTSHFKGNYPDRASLESCFNPGASLERLASATWTQLLPEQKLRPHHRHRFSTELRPAGSVSHVRLNIFPDGGVSRLRVYGTVAAL